ncbi:putative reverse transcriptase domain-containing protein [Tanacetum coccineum]
MKKKSIKKLVGKRVAKAIEEYEKTRVDSSNAGGSGSASTGGIAVVQGCSHKTFMNRKPHSFNGTEGVVGLKRWFEKIEQVFEICKCAKEDKVMFAASTFEVRALTWWNGNVQTLGLANANQIPWSNNQGKYHSSKPLTLHDANHWPVTVETIKFWVGLQELVRAIRGNDGAQNDKSGSMDKDCRARLPSAGDNFQQNVTCFGCGEKGHYKNKCPKAGNTAGMGSFLGELCGG